MPLLFLQNFLYTTLGGKIAGCRIRECFGFRVPGSRVQGLRASEIGETGR
jgi:hypothetical protein